MYELSVRKRSGLWRIVLGGLLALIAWAAVLLAQMRTEVDILYYKSLPALRTAGDLCENGYEIETRSLALLALPIGGQSEPAIIDLERLLKDSTELIATYQATIMHGNDRVNFQKTTRAFDAYATEVRRLTEARRARQPVAVGELLTKSAEYRLALSDLRDFRHARAGERVARSGSHLAAAFRLQLFMLSCAGAGIVTGSLLLLVVRRRAALSPSDF